MKRILKTKEDRRTTTERILDCLQDGTETSFEIFRICFPFPLSTYEVVRQIIAGKRPEYFDQRWSEIYRDKKRFQRLMSKLKNDGLIEKTAQGDRVLWQITQKGIRKKERAKFNLSNLSYYLQQTGKKKTKSIIIASYDIPESLQRERKWLREVFKLLDFEMVHKSVWVGQTIIPEFILKEFSRRKILNHIQIFEISKRGTLEELILKN